MFNRNDIPWLRNKWDNVYSAHKNLKCQSPCASHLHDTYQTSATVYPAISRLQIKPIYFYSDKNIHLPHSFLIARNGEEDFRKVEDSVGWTGVLVRWFYRKQEDNAIEPEKSRKTYGSRLEVLGSSL